MCCQSSSKGRTFGSEKLAIAMYHPPHVLCPKLLLIAVQFLKVFPKTSTVSPREFFKNCQIGSADW